jgi:hypothetical protein
MIPQGYEQLRLKIMYNIEKLNELWELSSRGSHPLLTARYLSPSSFYTGAGYLRGGLFLVRLNESNLSRHINNMLMLYDTTSHNYLPDQLFDPVFVAWHGPPKDRLTFDIEKLKRLLILLQAALAINGGGPIAHHTPVEQSVILDLDR